MRLRPSPWCVAAVVFAGACGAGEAPIGPPAAVRSSDANDDPATVTFSDATTCADIAGATAADRPCDDVMCDFVPEGSTFAETCGQYFQEGLTSSALSDKDVRRIADDVAGCVTAEHSNDEQVRVELAPEGWLSIMGPSGLIERLQQRLPPCPDRGSGAYDDR